MRTSLSTIVAVVAAGLLGGGAALAVGSAIWDGGTTTTVVQPASGGSATPASATANAAGAETRGSSSNTVNEVYRKDAPGVVQVTSSVVTQTFTGDRRGEALGSGFVVDEDGHVVTNYHVVEGADSIFVNFSSNDRLKASIVGVDPATDVALLKIDAHRRALSPLELGNSDAVQVGDPVIAIGNPFGLDRSVTAGIVSALQRQIESPSGFAIDKVIQTDAAINKGNSGGPLLNEEGQVIGINTQIATGGTGGEGNVGIGFAVPINTVKEVVGEIMRHGRADHAYVGITMNDITPDVARLANLPDKGAIIATVADGSPAAKAGLTGGDAQVVVNGESYTLGGDVITKVDGHAVESSDDVRSAVQAKEPGDKVELEIKRGDETRTVTVTLGRQPTSTSR